MKYILYLFMLISMSVMQFPAVCQEAETLDGRVVVRLEPGTAARFFNSDKTGRTGRSIIKSYQRAIPWSKPSANARKKPHPLADIYFIDLVKTASEKDVIDSLKKLPGVTYAEPYFVFRPLNEINDPLVSEQEHLSLIRAYEAWSVEKGDSTIVIGILDSGINPDHPELKDNIWININDPVNGIDDDGDGLVDNYRGWDMADNDNNVLADTDEHGTWVSGVSSARINNHEGIAGTGYRSKLLPVKIFKSNTNAFNKGYEAIVLAADMGCDVINLSWGSAGSYSAFGQDVINYAVLEKDVAIVAAAGNTDGELDFYPASYDHVLSVASTDTKDQKATWASYSRYVDITAPGVSILTTDGSSEYIRKSGTSLSAPQVAGTVALVRSRFPQLSAIQAMERVRVYSEPIYDIPGNQQYDQLLGKGRLDMFNALTAIGSPAIRISEIELSNGRSNEAYHGDSVSLHLEFTNYLHPANDIAVLFRSESPYVSLQNEEIHIGRLGNLESARLKDAVQFTLRDDTPAEEILKFTVEIKSGSYSDFQHFELKTADDRIDFRGGELLLTVAGNGNLGYAEDQFRDGVGLRYRDMTILKNAALLVASEDIVIDNLPDNLVVPFRNDDFTNLIPIKMRSNSIADRYALSTFRSTRDLSLDIEQELIGWNDNDAIVLEYRLTNIGESPIKDFRTGFFSDFDLIDPSSNRISWIDSLNLSITSSSGDLFAGIAMLSGPAHIPVALDKGNESGNASDLPAYIDDPAKLKLLNSDPKESAGVQGAGNDVASLLSGTAGILNPGESVIVTYVISVASSKESLVRSVQTAADDYSNFRKNPPLLMTSTYCPDNDPVIDPPGNLYDFYLSPDAEDKLLRTDRLTGEDLDTLDMVYVREIFEEPQRVSDIYAVKLLESDLNTDFTFSPDTLVLDERNQTFVQFRDQSNRAERWSWDFSNGYTSTLQHPGIHFSEAGDYVITLEATNTEGCTETMVKTLSVLRRSDRPEARIIEGCSPLSLAIEGQSDVKFRLYRDENMDYFIGEYDRLMFDGIETDSSLYFTATYGDLPESLPSPISFTIQNPEAAFTWYQDSTNLDNAALLHFVNDGGPGEVNWYVQYDNQEIWIGNGNTASLDYSAYSSFTIRQEVISGYGCAALSEISFTPGISETPEDISVDVCKGEGINLIFEDSFYHFYTESGILVAKGHELMVDSIVDDTTFYIRNVGELLESNSGTISINTISPDVYFELPEATFNMAYGTPLNLIASGADAERYEWRLNGRTIAESVVVNIDFQEPGFFEISLTATDKNGCNSSFAKNLQVVNITSSASMADSDEPVIYPNPAHHTLHIGAVEDIAMIRIREISGRLIEEFGPGIRQIDISNLKGGVYLIEIGIRGNVIRRRISINPAP